MKAFIAIGILAASLALTGNAAVAASAPIHKTTKVTHAAQARTAAHARSTAPARPARRVAARKGQPNGQLGYDIGQFIQAMLGGGGPIPYANLVRDAEHAGGSSSSAYSPSFEPSPTVTIDNSAAQAASDAETQAINQMNDTNALTASMAAAEEQNDEANAAALQTEINAGM